MEITNPLYAQLLKFKPKKGDLRKVEILEGAIETIANEGVERLSFESLGKKLNMRRAHVAYYFPDRDEIVLAAIKLVVATVQSFTVERVKLAASDEERLVAFVEGTFKWAETYPKHPPVILLLYYYSSHDKRYRKLHDEARRLGAERIEAIVRPLLPPARRRHAGAAAKLVQAILTGHLLDHYTTEPRLSLERLEERTLRDVRAAVKGFVRE